MKRYAVRFYPIPQADYEVDANSYEEAIKEAEALWKARYTGPDKCSVEEIPHQEERMMKRDLSTPDEGRALLPTTREERERRELRQKGV